MRIGIDFRFISGGENVVNRGTGRYTQHQVDQLLKIDKDNEYLLICHKDANINLILPSILESPNLTISYIPFDEMQIQNNPNHPKKSLRLAAKYQEWLESQRIDLYHATAPYQVNELVLLQIDVCPFVATLYDLIPMVYPDKYWGPGQPFYEELRRAYIFLSRADRLIAISDSARNDGCRYLGLPRERIDLAYPFPDPMFRRMPANWTEGVMRSIRQRLPIPENYIMSLSHIHHSKNLETLIAAYSQIPEHIRKCIPLVIVFYLRPEDRDLLDRWKKKYNVQENVILTGLVADDELVALYNAATIFVHPSRYEGFGLPVVEAMACGAPVITTTSSSLPEISGNAAVLVDPDDVNGFTKSILHLLRNPGHRDELRNLGLENVKRFNPERLGLNTLDSYRKAVEKSEPAYIRNYCRSYSFASTSSSGRPKVAIWSSLPPLPCGIADYTADILSELSQDCDVELFVDDGYVPSYDIIQRNKVHSYRHFERRHRIVDFDCVIYQLGYSIMQYYMFDAIRKYAGCVVIHDVAFPFGLYFVYAKRGELDEFKRKVIEVEGEIAALNFDEAMKKGDLESSPFFRENYLLKWVIDSSLAQVTHLKFAENIIRERYPNANVYTIDMGVRDPWGNLPVLNKRLVRLSICLPLNSFIVGVFGSCAPIKRIDVVLRSFRLLVDNNKDSLLIIVGSDSDVEYVSKLKSIVAEMNLTRNVRFLGYLSREEFEKHLLAVDVVVNLRYPSILQMSAVLMRSLAAGNPTIISDIPEWRYLPDSCCPRVSPDDEEVRNLARILIEMSNNRRLLSEMSISARNFYEERGTLQHCVQQYVRLIEEVSLRTRGSRK